MFCTLYRAILVYLEKAGKGGEALVNSFAFVKKKRDSAKNKKSPAKKEMMINLFNICFNGNDHADVISNIECSNNEGLRKFLNDKFGKILSLYIRGHFTYIPYELIKGISKGVFSVNKDINGQSFNSNEYSS